MKKKILAGLLLAGSTMFAAPRVSFGIGFGIPAPVVVAPPVYAAVPPCPGPGYVWSGGIWVAPGAYFGPHYYGGRYIGHPVARGYARGFRR